MAGFEWLEGMNIAVTVCDTEGVGLYLNEQAAEVFKREGGKALVGKNLLDCHPEPGRAKMLALLKGQRAHTYIMKRNGRRRLLHSVPWFKEGKFAGLVEIAFDVPGEFHM
jgi:transcriptional regulator with PAS, ATPase and Fis domain